MTQRFTNANHHIKDQIPVLMPKTNRHFFLNIDIYGSKSVFLFAFFISRQMSMTQHAFFFYKHCRNLIEFSHRIDMVFMATR
jgi:hypothetical protein